MGTGTLKTDVLKYWNTNYKGSVDNDLIGNVKLDIRGIKDSFGHGMTEEKAAAYAAVPEIIKGGVIIDYQKKWKGKPRDTIVIAAPIVIAGEEYLAGVIVNRPHFTDIQRYYTHDVVIQKIEQSNARNGDAEANRGATSKDYSTLQSLLRSVQKVNRNPIKYSTRAIDTVQFKNRFGSSVVTENGRPNGKPKILYHGTGSQFTVFDLTRSGENSREMVGDAAEGMFFFATEKEAYPGRAQDNGETRGQKNRYYFHTAIAIKEGADKGSISTNNAFVTLGSSPSAINILLEIAKYKGLDENSIQRSARDTAYQTNR